MKQEQTAEQLFDDNVRYNAMLAKRRQKKKMKWPLTYVMQGRGREFLNNSLEMIPLEKREVLARLADWGVIIKSPNTLRNWEKWGLIPEATFRNSRRVEYPDHTPAEGLASVRLLKKHRANNSIVRGARELALEHEAKDGGVFDLMVGGSVGTVWVNPEGSQVIGGMHDLKKALAAIWLRYKIIATKGDSLKDSSCKIIAEEEYNPGDENVMLSYIKVKKNSLDEPDRYLFKIWKLK